MLILGHRGVTTGEVNENTIDAFQLAKERGAAGIETDIRRTKDDKLILFHDSSIAKKLIKNLTYKQIENRIGYKPTILRELLRWASKDFILNLEVKDPSVSADVCAEIECVKNRTYIISSFSHASAFAIARNTGVECALLMPVKPVFVKPFLQLIPAKIEYIIWNYDVYTESLRVELPRFKHLLYNVGEIKPVEKCDGIISDHLDTHINSKRASSPQP